MQAQTTDVTTKQKQFIIECDVFLIKMKYLQINCELKKKATFMALRLLNYNNKYRFCFLLKHVYFNVRTPYPYPWISTLPKKKSLTVNPSVA